LRSDPPHTPQTDSGSSLNRWKTSMWFPQVEHAYSYVGTSRL